jgi:hypothetical protein
METEQTETPKKLTAIERLKRDWPKYIGVLVAIIAIQIGPKWFKPASSTSASLPNKLSCGTVGDSAPSTYEQGSLRLERLPSGDGTALIRAQASGDPTLFVGHWTEESPTNRTLRLISAIRSNGENIPQSGALTIDLKKIQGTAYTIFLSLNGAAPKEFNCIAD